MSATISTRTVALAGNPNAGKTTLFNGLTGLRQKVANYPGITVEKKTGRAALPDGTWIDVLDLPGTYSLVPHSPDEMVAAEVLRGQRADTPAPDVIIAVIDASNLPRNLYMFSQLCELGRPLVVALNMMDVAARRGVTIDVDKLERTLGVPVIPVIGNRHTGIDRLLAAAATATTCPTLAWALPEPAERELATLAALLTGSHAAIQARRLLTGEDDSVLATLRSQPAIATALTASHERLAALAIEPLLADIEARYHWIDRVVTDCVQSRQAGTYVSERLDAVLLHPVAGLGIFATIMGLLFVAVFWVAAPLNDWCEGAVVGLGAWLTSGMADSTLKSLLTDGIFAGIAAVVVFVPQIALLFTCLAILEDSGYLARAAFLMDRALSKVGLHGKSFIPLLSSFACAIPGILATRTIESRRERLATILVAPFMSCSARLPVYALLIGAFFAVQGALVQGLVLLGCYLLGIVAAAVVGWLFKLAHRRTNQASAFILELPTYKVPQTSLVAWQVWNGTKAFLTKAGTTIFCLSVLIWAASTWPRADVATRTAAAAQAEARERAAPASDLPLNERIAAAREHAEIQANLANSAAGRLGKAMEPLIAPLGFDWKTGVGLVGAFAAREVFNSTLAIIHNLGAREADDITDLQAAIVADRHPDGTAVWRPLTAISLLIWFVLAMQCISTTAVVKRETGGWTWPLIQLGLMNAIAYVCCLAVYQIGSALGY